MDALRNISTTKYLVAFVAMILCSAVLEFVGDSLWVSHQIPTFPLEVISSALGWIGMIGVFASIPISAFRPRNRFSLSGDCWQRAKLFILSVLAAVGLIVWYALMIAASI